MGAPLRFIHCADLHLGSRFVGVTSQDEGLGRRLSTATFDALENLVEAANREAVDFVLFSGDVFDSSNETPYARSRFADAVSRINSVCYIAYGNHDFRRLWEDVIPLPENAIVFGPEPEKRFYPPGPEAKVCITGVSHSRKAHTESLADGFEPESGFFNIGVVHCDVDAQESPYSPVPLKSLTSKGFDYWALGHIHKPMVLSTDPYVVYPGCTQGRSSKDSGPRGAYLVTVQDGSVVRTDFITLCAIEWTDVRVTIGMDMDLPAFVAAASSRCRPGSLVRLFADGTGPLNSKLRLYGPDVRKLFEEATGCICTGLEVSTLPEIDLDERSRSGDFTAMVISHGHEMAKSMSRQEIIDAICFTGASSYLRPIFESMDSEELRGLLEDAVAFVVEKMREAESR